MNLRDEVVMAHWLETHMGRTALLSLREDGVAVDDSALASADMAVNSALQSAQRALSTSGQTWMSPDQAPMESRPTS